MRTIFHPETGHHDCLRAMSQAEGHLQWATFYATSNPEKALMQMRLALRALNAGRCDEDPCPTCLHKRYREWEQSNGTCLYCNAPVLPEVTPEEPAEAERERQAALTIAGGGS